jgi:hypothetical protein
MSASSAAEEGTARPGSCNRPTMECPPSQDSLDDRLARAAARVNTAMAQVSQAEALLTDAMQRLALARLTLKELRHPSTPHNPSADDDAMDPK